MWAARTADSPKEVCELTISEDIRSLSSGASIKNMVAVRASEGRRPLGQRIASFCQTGQLFGPPPTPLLRVCWERKPGIVLG